MGLRNLHVKQFLGGAAAGPGIILSEPLVSGMSVPCPSALRHRLTHPHAALRMTVPHHCPVSGELPLTNGTLWRGDWVSHPTPSGKLTDKSLQMAGALVSRWNQLKMESILSLILQSFPVSLSSQTQAGLWLAVKFL